MRTLGAFSAVDQGWLGLKVCVCEYGQWDPGHSVCKENPHDVFKFIVFLRLEDDDDFPYCSTMLWA